MPRRNTATATGEGSGGRSQGKKSPGNASAQRQQRSPNPIATTPTTPPAAVTPLRTPRRSVPTGVSPGGATRSPALRQNASVTSFSSSTPGGTPLTAARLYAHEKSQSSHRSSVTKQSTSPVAGRSPTTGRMPTPGRSPTTGKSPRASRHYNPEGAIASQPLAFTSPPPAASPAAYSAPGFATAANIDGRATVRLSLLAQSLPKLAAPLSFDAGDDKCIPATLVLPYLYVGSSENAFDADFLREHNITCTINLMHELVDGQPSTVTQHHHAIADTNTANIHALFEQLTALIHKERSRKVSVLVHCQKGVSRSPTVVAAYLVRYNGWCVEEALRHLTKRRPMVDPNFGFLDQLKRYEESIPMDVRKAVRAKFSVVVKNLSSDAQGTTELANALEPCGEVHEIKYLPGRSGMDCIAYVNFCTEDCAQEVIRRLHRSPVRFALEGGLIIRHVAIKTSAHGHEGAGTAKAIQCYRRLTQSPLTPQA